MGGETKREWEHLGEGKKWKLLKVEEAAEEDNENLNVGTEHCKVVNSLHI